MATGIQPPIIVSPLEDGDTPNLLVIGMPILTYHRLDTENQNRKRDARRIIRGIAQLQREEAKQVYRCTLKFVKVVSRVTSTGGYYFFLYSKSNERFEVKW